jgi:hypothetical protein
MITAPHPTRKVPITGPPGTVSQKSERLRFLRLVRRLPVEFFCRLTGLRLGGRHLTSLNKYCCLRLAIITRLSATGV